MSSYVDAALSPGETVAYRAGLSHWKFALHYLIAAAFVAGAVLWLMFEPASAPLGASVLGVIALAVFVYALVKRSTTELVLTNRRFILKRGLIARDTIEMNLAKVESLRVTQSILGRMLDYGDVAVIGTGSSLEPIRGIARPLELRKRIGSVA